jgi:hypothetical protein
MDTPAMTLKEIAPRSGEAKYELRYYRVYFKRHPVLQSSSQPSCCTLIKVEVKKNLD